MPDSTRNLVAGALLLIAATAVAYIPALRAGYIWDDDTYVVNNELLRTPGGLGRIWSEPGATQQYYPLVYTTYWIEYRLWGLNAAGYHAVNVLLHAVNAIVVWLVLRRLAPGQRPGLCLAEPLSMLLASARDRGLQLGRPACLERFNGRAGGWA